MKNNKSSQLVEVFVGKMLPINDGLYKRDFIKSKHKPKQKIFVGRNEQELWDFANKHPYK